MTQSLLRTSVARGVLFINALIGGAAEAQTSAKTPQTSLVVPSLGLEGIRTKALHTSEFLKLREKADGGCPVSQCEIANQLYLGATRQNTEEAIRLFEKSASLKHPPAMFALGQILLLSEGTRERGVKLIRGAADLGHPCAQAAIADWMQCGLHGQAVDSKQAFEWYCKAANQGNVGAQFALGNFYCDGLGTTERDSEKARHWFKKAAEQGDTLSMLNLGSLLAEDRPMEAINWYKKASERGSSLADVQIGRLITKEKVEGAERQDALKWFRSASVRGSSLGDLLLGMLLVELGDEANAKEALTHLHRAANSGLIEACRTLASLHANGKPGFEKSESLATQWLQKGAELGSTQLQFLCGQLALEGGDTQAASRWLQLAADKGHLNSKQALGLLYLGSEPAKALPLLTECSRHGMVTSSLRLGRLLSFGSPTVPAQPVAAREHLVKAVKGGSSLAALYLGELLSSQQLYEEAIPLLRKAADNKYPSSYTALVGSLVGLAGPNGNISSVRAPLESSADLGFIESQFQLANLLSRGAVGVERNPAEAFKWYMRAAKQGHTQSQRALADAYHRGNGVLKNYFEAFKWSVIADNGELSGETTQLIRRSLPREEWVKSLGLAKNFEASCEKTPEEKPEAPLFLDEPKLPILAEDLAGASVDEMQTVPIEREIAERLSRLGGLDLKLSCGVNLLKGLRVKRDEPKGIALIREAAEGKLADAQYLYSQLLLSGKEPNETAAEHWLEQAAAQGHVQAQFGMGQRCEARNQPSAAIKWFTEAAGQGHIDSKVRLAFALYQSAKAPAVPDFARISSLLAEAADRAHPVAQYNLAQFMLDGKIAGASESKAVELLSAAAANWEPHACLSLGLLYLRGERGLSQDLDRTRQLFDRALESGVRGTARNILLRNLASLLSRESYAKKDPLLAVKYLTEAAEADDPRAAHELGVIYTNGKSIPQDPRAALAWFERSASSGHLPAQRDLAEMYAGQAGRNFTDLVRADAWARVAKANGANDLDDLLKRLSESLTTEQEQASTKLAKELWDALSKPSPR